MYFFFYPIFIYIFIHHNMIERTEQKVQQKSTQKKKEKITTMKQVTQIYIYFIAACRVTVNDNK